MAGVTPTHAQTTGPTTPTPATLEGLGSLTHGGVSDPVIETPTQAQLEDHARRLDFGRAHAISTGPNTVGPNNVSGNYNGKSRNVGTGLYPEPNHSPYANYCGPGASQVLISNWTTNVPGIDTLASEEHTHATYYSDGYGTYVGTWLSYMVGPINSHIGTSFYSNVAASSQGAFNNYVGGDVYDKGRPMITALMTEVNNGGQIIWLNGWNTGGVIAPHIVTITGFNFSNPQSAGDNFYYQETSGTYAGTNATGRDTFGANQMWSLVNANNGQIW